MCQILSNISVSDTVDVRLYSSSLGLDGMQAKVWRESVHVIVRLPFTVLERLQRMEKVLHCRRKANITTKFIRDESSKEDLGVLVKRKLTMRQLSTLFKRRI